MVAVQHLRPETSVLRKQKVVPIANTCRASYQQPEALSRRQIMSSTCLITALSFGCNKPATAAKDTVDQFLSPAGFGNFFTYIPPPGKTSALRSGAIATPYQFVVPGNWKEAKIPNALTGNYCMPKCGEPWVEAIFENNDEGKVRLLVTYITKLTPNPKATIRDVGSLETVIPQIGPYITNTQLEAEEVISAEEVRGPDGQTYFAFESYAPYALFPPHAVFRFTVKDGLAYLLVANATDKQWAKSERTLKQIIESFAA